MDGKKVCVAKEWMKGRCVLSTVDEWKVCDVRLWMEKKMCSATLMEGKFV